MSNYLKLISINLRTFFQIDKILNAKDKNELRNKCLYTLFIIAALGYFGYFIYDFSKNMLMGFNQLNIPHILLAMFFCFSNAYILFTNIYKINGVLFNYKDYDMLMSLPIKRSTVILSKITTLYVSSLIYVLLLMVPALIAYVQVIDVNFTFYILYIITTLLLPLVPLIISTIIGTIITAVTSKFKMKSLVNTIVMLIFVFGIMYFSYQSESLSNIDMANIGNTLVNKFNSIYPLTNTYINIIKDNNMFSLLIFIIIPIVLFSLFLIGINKFYVKVNNNLTRSFKLKNYKLKVNHKSTALGALYKKELKRFLNSPMYLLNSGLGSILLVVCVLALAIVGQGKIDEFMGIQGLSDMFAKTGPIVMGIFCCLSCTTHSSISLEGKNLWIMKSIPASPMTIYMSKVLVNLTVLVPSILISSIVLGLYLKVSLLTYLFLIVTPIIYAIFISLIGLILNLNYPNFNYTSEVRVIKQSLPAFLSIIIGFIVGLIPLNIKYSIDSNLFIFIVTMVIFVIDLILYMYLEKVWTKKFIKLGN